MVMRQLVTASIVSVFLVTQALAACPPGSLQGLNAHQCYVISNESTTWSEAEEDCASLGGHLASVSGTLSNLFLHWQFKSPGGDYWLGGYYAMYFHDIFPKTWWSWSDGERFAFSDWAQGEPMLANPACLAVDYETGNWRSVSCDEAKLYVCKVPEVTAPTGESTVPPTTAYCPPNVFCA